ncbi:MAG: hypothetical protein LBG92_01730 [Prevotellaceae bacterium]|jgi:hypothetical protein|nr:hypothetical protein [Prevotellaceae bacterium]
MKNILIITVLALSLITAGNTLHAQGQLTTIGNDFWLTYGDNDGVRIKPGSTIDSLTLQLRFVAPRNTQISLSFTSNISLNATISVTAGQVYTYSLSKAQKEALYNDNKIPGISNRSLHVTSDYDISMFAINIQKFTSDATNVLPTSNLGTDYYHLSYMPHNNLQPNVPGDGFCIVATQNGTKIEIDGVYTATINAGEVYSKYYEQINNLWTDNTGRHITADKPVAFFSVNSCVNVPVVSGTCDCLFQQMLPVSTWGKKFLIPVTNRGREHIRIIASQNGTTVTHTVGNIVQGSLNLNAGQFVELEISQKDQGCYIESDKPVAVGSYLLSGTALTALPQTERGDPSITLVPPLEQSVSHTVISPFIPSGTSALNVHYAIVIVPTAHVNATTYALGGGPTVSLAGEAWVHNSASGYSYIIMKMDKYQFVYTYENPYGLIILGYGLGNAESYYYMAAASARQLDAYFSIDDINDMNFLYDIHFQDANGQTYCNSEFTFTASIQYPLSMNGDRLKWYIDGVERTDLLNLEQWTAPAGYFLTGNGKHKVKLLVTDNSIYSQTRELETEFTVLPNATVIPATDLPAVKVCENSAPTITVKNTNSNLEYRVWSASTGGTMVGSAQGNGGTLDIQCVGNLNYPITSVDYYVESYNGKCPSLPRTKVSIQTVSPPILPYISANERVCAGSKPVVTISSSVAGITYEVYTDSHVLVGSAAGTNSQLKITLNTVPTASPAKYYVEAVNQSTKCRSLYPVEVTFTVNTPPSMATAQIDVKDVMCFGGTDGNIKITGVTGNIALYYYGNKYSSSSNSGPLVAGTYQIYVSDINGCFSDTVTKTITQPAAITSTITVKDVSCRGANDGSVSISTTGGVPPYQYSIDNGQHFNPGHDFFNLSVGDYDIVIKDANNCTTVAETKTISQPQEFTVPDPTVTDISCNGSSDGCITVSGVTGGTQPYEYSIDGGMSYSVANSTGNVLAAGVYDVIVRDKNGCVSPVKQVIINEPPILLTAADVHFAPVCLGSIAKINIYPSKTGVEYKVYDDRTGGMLRGSGNGNGSLLEIDLGIMDDTDSLFIETFTTATSCTAISRVGIKTNIIRTLINYPDIRVHTCLYPAQTVNLSKYVDTSYLTNITWASVGYSASVDPQTGIINSDLLTGTNTHIYTYTISNNCISNYTRRLYLHIIKNSNFNMRTPDTVTVCYKYAEVLQINQIFGMDFEGTLTYDTSIPGIQNYMNLQTPSNGLIFNGKGAYEAGILPSVIYNGQTARYINFEYTSSLSSCLNGKKFKITVVLIGM